jgi:3-oxoacyl-[acyl-carrier protein] reductase
LGAISTITTVIRKDQQKTTISVNSGRAVDLPEIPTWPQRSKIQEFKMAVERIAIVTGAAHGIGEACAHVLAGQGKTVAVVDIDFDGAQKVAEAIKATGRPAKAYHCDVSRPAAVEQLVRDVVADFGQVDVLVNNAGICPRIAIEDMTEEWFDRIVNVNMKSVFFLTRAAAEDMKKRRWGRVVNVSSTGGRIGGVYRATVYSGTKAAILAISKTMAREYASFGILINCVAPGAVDTEMMTKGMANLESYVQTVPLRRLAKPIEIAHSIAHLCADETTWVTGATLDVNGGVVMV